MLRLSTLVFAFSVAAASAQAQSTDEAMIKKIFSSELSAGTSYSMLEHLSTKIGHRLSGSPGAAEAVKWTAQTMKEFADTVWLQPVMVPRWVRGEKETAQIIRSSKRPRLNVNVCALGGSIGTGAKGLRAQVVEVKSFDELTTLGEAGVQGKIVFFNRPMDPTLLSTFSAYSLAVDQRGSGAAEAAKFGAVGVVVRSMGSNLETYPHTGSMRYQEGVPQIPAIAISTSHAETLSQSLKEDSKLEFYFRTTCSKLPDALSYNVIGEIRGSSRPDEVIVASGHLDSWDLGQGAHDDGAGCVQAMEVLRLFRNTGYKPTRTIRTILFMNEENGLRGGTEYGKWVELRKEKHIAAMESDRGGFVPRGFSMTAPDAARNKMKSWRPLLEPYGLTDFEQKGGGADISPLEKQGIPVIGFLPDSQRYFKYHHTEEDTFDKVDKRELELGAASMAAMIYLIDQHGLD